MMTNVVLAFWLDVKMHPYKNTATCTCGTLIVATMSQARHRSDIIMTPYTMAEATPAEQIR